ncbi:kinase-like domain-containing protein [Rhizophagus irregularis DAOM 181602=DAOM 197198]|nr:kinase-like domain-containing protein [Rhizophagus irregularis DAOM 181602=DAOM 197198]
MEYLTKNSLDLDSGKEIIAKNFANWTRNNGLATAIWKEGSLHYCVNEWIRISYEKVVLKFLYDSQNISDEFINKTRSYTDKKYGLSQNPDTRVGDDCLNTAMWKDGPLYYDTNKKEWVKEAYEKVCLKYLHNLQDITDEVINKIKSYLLGHYGDSLTTTIWRDGPLYYDTDRREWTRESYVKVCLNYLHNLQDFTDEVINKIKSYLLEIEDNCLATVVCKEGPFYYDTSEAKWIRISYKIVCLRYLHNSRDTTDEVINKIESYLINGYIEYYGIKESWERKSNTRVALKCLHNSQNFIDEFINEVKAYPNQNIKNILKIYGISQNPNTKDYIMVLEYAEAPEVLRGKTYTQAADVYSFGMIMYVVATGQQPFIDCAHDGVLALSIYNEIRPEINEKIIPKCYVDLMKRCWDSNPDNRPNSIEINELINLFYYSLDQQFEKKVQQHYEIEKQFNETQRYRRKNILSIKNNQLITHTQAIYTSRLLNPYTNNLSKYDTVEITDFIKLHFYIMLPFLFCSFLIPILHYSL